ncbi:MAG TPA: hypothetical protein VJY54_14555 [Lachnospiraceae bacterium]|nr:hypothetical protein [Lachnospiraceae bacterium]
MKNKIIIITIIMLVSLSTTACCLHKWVDTTCAEPKHCTRCGETQGESLKHNIQEWTITQIASCTAPGTQTGICSRCGKTVKKGISKINHTEGTLTITKEATFDTTGEKILTCSVCGCILDTETYELSDDEKELQYKQACESYKYDDLARNPEKYAETYAKYFGRIIQVIEGGDGYVEMLIATKKEGGIYWDDILYTSYQRKEGEDRFLEDDLVTIYGLNSGDISYESVMAGIITIPYVAIEYIIMGKDQ